MRKDLVGNISFAPVWGNNFFRDFDRVFEEAFRPMVNSGASYPPVDIYVEKDEKLVFEVALAGFRKDEVKVEVEKNVLYISSNTDEVEKEDRKYIKHKIARRQFNLAYSIPDVYDVDTPDADFTDGVLTISFIKKESTKPLRKQIELG